MSDGIERVYGYFPRLKERRAVQAGYLSGGEQQMLVIGRALMASPHVMLLDEPSLGLAPMLVEEIFAIVRALNRKEKLTVLLVEQNATLALTIAEHGYVMENGRIVLEGSAEELRENADQTNTNANQRSLAWRSGSAIRRRSAASAFAS